MSSHNFSNITTKLAERIPEAETEVRHFCVKSSTIPLTEFNNRLAEKLSDISSQITPSKERPTISEFKAALKNFDDYPTNLQKPRRTVGREMSRPNQSVMKSHDNEGATDGTMANERSLNNTAEDNGMVNPRPGDIYNDFKQFRVKMSSLVSNLAQQQSLVDDHCVKIEQFHLFKEQLDKLMSTEELGNTAFTADEENIIEAVATSVGDLNAMRSQEHIYQAEAGSNSDSMRRLNGVTDIIEYILQNEETI